MISRFIIFEMKYTIREATSNDYPFILELINEFAYFQKTPEKVTKGKL